MSAASILLGSVLTFASTDGRSLQLTISLTEPATVALAWGELTRSATAASERHTLGPLPVPEGTPTRYVLSVGREPPRVVSVDPIGGPEQLRIANYGDSRDGSAPHRLVLEQILTRAVDVLVHTGDVIHAAQDERGWIQHLSASFPLSSRRPIILALGNHELAQSAGPRVDGLARAMREIPPPPDPIARELGAPLAAFHVRVGPALFVSIDSNQSLAEGSPQLAFLERVLEQRGDARSVFVCMHHGPRSSGPHGPHRDAAALVRVLEKHRVTASLAGHDHIYERIVQNGVTYLVSGGGGAPLYRKSAETPGLLAFASTYNWVQIDLAQDKATFEAFSLEGVTLDRGVLGEPGAKLEPASGEWNRTLVILAFAGLLVAFLWAGQRLSRPRA